MTLDQTSIRKAIKVLENFEKSLKPAAEKLMEHFAEEGVNIARAELVMFDPPAFYTGTLAESIDKRPGESGSWIVSAGNDECDYAMYVEYGTGMGRGPSLHGVEGWVYHNDRDGGFYWTRGMDPRPFMYNTLIDLEEKVKIDGGTVIAEYLRE